VRIAEGVFLHADASNCYVLRDGREAVLIDIGSGDVLDHLADYGVDRVTDILMTHHHRDGAQGLARAAELGIRIHVPPSERDLFAAIDDHWQGRSLDNNYDLREDRFSILESVPVTDVVREYHWAHYGAATLLALPTPGHTLGSVTYFADIDGRRLAFTGDLIAAPGKVWSLASMQWSYTGMEGVPATMISTLSVLDHRPDVLLPAHGSPMDEPIRAVALLNERLQRLIDERIPGWRPTQLRELPFEELSPHLLRNRTSQASSYVLLSQTGGALLFDYGYDFITGLPTGSDRSARRPWLETVRALKQRYGVDRVEVAIPTHYHDDHVAGFNLLREVEGTEVWSPANMTRIFREPRRFDLPCLWFDPIGVDREVAFGEPLRWHEYELRVHELPGHTLYAAAIEVEVDGMKVLATGDQQGGRWTPEGPPEALNYQYRNRFRIDDFVRSAQLYRDLAPDLVISGHWAPRPVTPEWLDEMERGGREVARIHRELLPLEDVDFDAEGFGARIEPYQSEVEAGSPLELEVEVRNPFARRETADVTLVAPEGWTLFPATARVVLEPNATARCTFRIVPTGPARRRARIAADLSVGERRFGQHAEAVVTVRDPA
jgi:glyoxylase-like metal-dependent hydrolase (beta-lactamase superfamily II)